MITYTFICKNCGNEKIIPYDPSKISELEVTCEKCNTKMRRNWKTLLTVPDYMKADESQEMSWVKDRLKNRPSGKRRVLF